MRAWSHAGKSTRDKSCGWLSSSQCVCIGVWLVRDRFFLVSSKRLNWKREREREEVKEGAIPMNPFVQKRTCWTWRFIISQNKVGNDEENLRIKYLNFSLNWLPSLDGLTGGNGGNGGTGGRGFSFRQRYIRQTVIGADVELRLYNNQPVQAHQQLFRHKAQSASSTALTTRSWNLSNFFFLAHFLIELKKKVKTPLPPN